MYEVNVIGSFSASHQIHCPDGTLEPLHEHVWQVELQFHRAELDSYGIVVDFVAAQERLQATLDKLAGTCLNTNQRFGEANPTAEHVARWIMDDLYDADGDFGCLNRVTVEEAPGCRASFMIGVDGAVDRKIRGSVQAH